MIAIFEAIVVAPIVGVTVARINRYLDNREKKE